MSTLRARGLAIDDPLAPTAADSSPVEDCAHRKPTKGATPSKPKRPRPPKANRAAQPPERSPGEPNRAWRSWNGASRPATYRLPDELLDELARAADEQQLPIGMLVAAAITHILDLPAPAIAVLVERAEDARIQGRRSARRTRTASAAP